MDNSQCYRIRKMSPQFVVADLDCSLGFYTNVLGFKLDFRYEDFYLGISKDGHSIHLKLGGPSPKERKSKRNTGGLDLTFSVSNIEALYAAFSNIAVEIIQPLRQMPYGKEFYIVDPDGYIIAFLEEM